MEVFYLVLFIGTVHGYCSSVLFTGTVLLILCYFDCFGLVVLMAEVKTTVTDVIPVMTKIMKHKLNGSNFLDWSKTIRIYL